MWGTIRVLSETFKFLMQMHDMFQAVKSNDSCLVFQWKDVIDIEKQLSGDFTNICEWFVDKS